MTFAWTDYVRVAKDLLATNTEGALRSAISRAYYASYRTARDVAVKNSWVKNKRRILHAEVWDAFLAQSDARARRLGAAGRILNEQRTAADYETVFPNPLARSAYVAVAMSERLIRELAAL